jgi:hypothetical protein
MPLDLEEGRITAFKNDKEGNDKRPDYRGELKTPEGTHLQFSLWIREAKSGVKYMSGQVEPLREQNGAKASAGDDLPF